MPEIILDQPQVVAAIGKGKPAEMAKHVGMDMAKTGTVSGSCENVVGGLSGKRLLPLRNEHPMQSVITLPEPASDYPQFVALNGMLDAEPPLQPLHPKAGLRQIDMIPPQGNCFRDPKPVPEHHQDQQMIASAMPTGLCGGKKSVNLHQA
ncbi:hypothetical protein PANO111632_18855 [Paracoccus nototheniae]|nr:hypothetical protein [Paracoccus nototheniae]